MRPSVFSTGDYNLLFPLEEKQAFSQKAASRVHYSGYPGRRFELPICQLSFTALLELLWVTSSKSSR